MFGRKIKRRPGRPWGSVSKVTSDNRSWTPSNRKPVYPKGKPPGRPWHSNTSTKVCLLCLHQYNEDLISSDEEEEEEEEDDPPIPVGPDPLSDDEGVLTVDVVKASPVKKKKEVKGKRTGLYLKFLRILARHLRVKTKRFRNSAEKNELEAPFCSKCGKVIKKLCQVYVDWHKIKLELEWRLRQVKEAIKMSKERCRGSVEVAVLKSLSTQLRVFSSQFVGILRKQISIQCGAKLNNQFPKVTLDKDSCLKAVKANWKWKYSFDQVRHYLQSLIVVFVLAAPPKDPPPPPPSPPKKKVLPLAGPKSKVRKVQFTDLALMVKREGVEAKKENVPPKLKGEPGQQDENSSVHCGNDEDHFVGGDSPPGSGPTSPIGNDDDDGDIDDANKNGDSDWSGGGAPSGNDSDADFNVSSNTSRRWNLRRRCTRKSTGQEATGNDSDEDYVPGSLPPLRRPRKPRESLDNSSKNYSCNLCNLKFSMERGLKRHLGQAHGFLMQYNCPKCPHVRFRRWKDLDEHRKKVHKAESSGGSLSSFSGKPTKCNHCDLIFPSKIKMQRHRKTTHKLMDTVYTCETCGKSIRGFTRFNLHRQAHNRPDKPYRCVKCPRGFGTAEGLKCHEKLHEQNPDWKPFQRVKKRKGDLEPIKQGTFVCDEPNCGKTFWKRSNLTIHKSLHKEDFKCDMCDAQFTITRDFRRHLILKHETAEKKFFCCHCDKTFTIEQTWDLHRKIAHPTKATLLCDVDECQEEFETTEQLRQHLRTLHLPPDVLESKENVKFFDVYSKDKPENEKKTENEEKSEKVEESKNLDENQFEDLLLIPSSDKDSEEIPRDPPCLYTCPRCDWSFCSKINYSLHLIVHTERNDKRRYPCELCDKSFGIVDTLQTHYNRIHGPRIKPYCCLVCGARFHRKESFIPHMRVHQDKDSSQDFSCDMCDKKFRDSVNLGKHKRIAHKTLANTKACDECSETFAGKAALQIHKHEVHGAAKPFICPADGCGKGFYTQGQLKDHKISHGEAIYQCPMCPKMFKRRHNLDDHILVHKQIKNHFCEYCGRSFVKKSSLNLHLDIHRGIKKYKCDYCGKEFCRKFARDCHLRIHTKERPFKCDICGRDFAQYSSLKSHVRSHETLNSDKIKRRPFKKSVGVGKPLRLEGVEELKNVVVNEEPTYSGILSDAMKASMLGEMENGGEQKIEGGAVIGGDGGLINEELASSAVQALEESIKESDSDQESDESEELPPVKRKRRPKTRKKEYSCGFCGKLFYREDFFNRHVNKHMTEDGGPPSLTQESSQSLQEQTSIQEALQDQQQPQQLYQSPPLLTAVPVQQQPPPLEYHPPPPPPPAQTPPRKRGRPSKQNSTPGSRLARIVEDVLETAINRPKPNVQIQYQQQSPQQIVQSPHSGSEHSTPAGSPGPMYPHQQGVATTTTSGTSLPSFPSSSVASFLSPFLYTNPYLIPRPADQGQQSQQDPMLSGFPSRQQPQQGFSQPPAVNYPQAQFHQLPIQTTISQTASRTVAQDLSKNTNYSAFYNNQR